MRLGVWERNIDALGFYRRMGFTEAGRHSFRMGDEVQSDYVMKMGVAAKETCGERDGGR